MEMQVELKLVGPPGCGKTQLQFAVIEAIKDLLQTNSALLKVVLTTYECQSEDCTITKKQTFNKKES